MQTKVPFVDLSRIHAPLKAEILNRISSVIDRSAFVLGPDVEAFEKDFAAFIGAPHAVGVSNGLDALKVALQAVGVGPGDEVVIPANTFIATAYAVSALGATPVLVDCEEKSYNLDPALLERAITPKTRCILPVHLYGQPAEMAPIMEIADARKIPVVEDCAQSHGAQYRGRTTGTFGKIGCFSFYPGKNLGAMGEGGACVTADDGLRARLRTLRDVGQKEKYVHELLGHNARLHTMQAVILSAKLPHLRAQNEDRARAARRYGELLAGVRGLTLPRVADGRTHVWHLYVVATPGAQEREGLRKHLNDQGIQCGIHYPTPIHLQACYRHLGKGPGSYPVTERLAQSILSLPMFCGMKEEELQAVAAAVRSYFKC
jgi:dTDP-4-amino-4,6-dideoxygalactose transaminase